MIELLLTVAAASAPLHEDDPKLLDRQPPTRGAAWRSPLGARPGAPLSAAAPPLQFEADGVTLVAWFPLDEFAPNLANGNDCWGYVSPSGREYAILGTSGGTGFLEVSDPANASVVDFIPGPSSLWRDVKTFDRYAYVVSEGGGGIQVLDLSAIDAGEVTVRATVLDGPGTPATHNVAIDADSARLYRAGGGLEGLRIYDLSNPAQPAFLGSFDDRYVHDVQVVTYAEGPYAGRQLAFACSGFNGGLTETGLEVIDVTDPANPASLARAFWDGAGFSHQCWLSPDRSTVYVDDELDETLNGGPTRTLMFDVSDPANPQALGEFFGSSTAVGHNLYTEGDLIYEANYRNGLEIFDASGPGAPTVVASFDTYPEDDEPRFNGLWSVYPFFPSGLVIGSDLERGLFVWVIDDPELTWVLPGGLPDFASASGLDFVARLDSAEGATVVPGSAKLIYDRGQGQVEALLTPLGNGDYRVELPAVPCGESIEFFLVAQSDTGLPYYFPNPAQPAGLDSLADSLLLASFQMESDDGWSPVAPGDTDTPARWERGDPVASTVNGQPFSPEDDTTPGGTDVWTTALATNTLSETSFAGGLTNGRVTLTTPVLDLTGVDQARVAYQRWVAIVNPDGTSTLTVDVSADGGSSWVQIERLAGGSEAGGGWFRAERSLDGLVPPSAQTLVRFVVEAQGAGVIDVAIDDFEVIDGVCEPLSGSPVAIPASGGSQDLSLEAGPGQAGALYLLLGSATGTQPGAVVGGVTIPLAPDAYTAATVQLANQGPFVETLGTLDGSGRGAASIDLPGGVPTALIGLTLGHAYVLIDATGAVSFASNPVPLELLP